MTISQKDLRILFQRSGNRCSFPGCIRLLIPSETELDSPVVLSEVAHIVGQSLDGPRGEHPLPLSERDKYDNLILLCEEHHHIVDSQPRTYTVERLRQMKSDHESLIERATGQAKEAGAPAAELAYVRETLYSTLFPVLVIPRYVYSVACEHDESEVVKKIVRPKNQKEMYPFIVRGGMLYCFQNLRDQGGPFRDLAGKQKVNRDSARNWWADPDRLNWYMTLLNRSLNKLTGRKGLNLDKDHKRYYFQPQQPGEQLLISYRPLNQSETERSVVWQPITKKTGLPKSYWYHLAVSMNFYRVGEEQWCLSLRPEIHVTKDGVRPLESERIGSRVTRKKSRMFNYDLLREVHFWRDFLSNSQPRIIFPFGGQSMIVSSTMMQVNVEWPGIPAEYAKAFKNVEYADDLFTWAELVHVEDELEAADEEDWVEDDTELGEEEDEA